MGPPKPSDPSCDDEISESGCPVTPVIPLPRPYPPPPPPPPHPASHGPRTFVTALVIAASVLAFLAVCLSIFLFVRRRRLRRRQRRDALLEAALALALAPAAPGDGPGGQEVTHHAWHIRTVGLDAAAIESIALTPYRAGGALGASDCTVCLGEFQDGELLRLLPKCAHAFHVQCIDTWLRAHVNCPLCRADVVDPAAEQPGAVPPLPGADADADASAQQLASNQSVEHGQPEQRADELQGLRGQSDQPDRSGSQEERPRRHPGARAQNFRRVASMDSPLPTASAEESLPEHDQADGEKQGTAGGAVCCEAAPGSAGHLNRPAMERSLSAGSRWRWTARHARARSSLLPL
ncbi:hypothetical protein BS78_04G171200 [Paspalum vaginatum]|nr:hypothetical protein BS78_04G171200 [Paspalum vaginatum]